MMRKIHQVRVTAVSFAKLVEGMLDGTMSRHELAEYTGLHYITVCHYVRQLHRQGAAYICGWANDTNGKNSRALLKIGIGKDVKRPVLTGAQRQANYLAKKRALRDPRFRLAA